MAADRLVFGALVIALFLDHCYCYALPRSGIAISNDPKYHTFSQIERIFLHKTCALPTIPVYQAMQKLLFANNESNFDAFEDDFNMNILFMADHSMYEAFYELALGDDFSAQYALEYYLRGVYEEMSVIYNRLVFFTNRRIKLHIVGTFIARRAEDCPLKTFKSEMNRNFNETDFDDDYSAGNISDSTVMSLSINALTAVNGMHGWIRQHTHLLPSHDHAILLTKFDLLSSRNDSTTQGMAYVGAMCVLGDSSSVVEDIGGLTTAVIAAHELAHSLGAYHDGSGSGKDCSPKSNYLLSPVASGTEEGSTFANSLLLSQCSTRQIEKFLRMNQAICLRKKVETKQKQKFKKSLEQSTQIRPGELFDRNRQCQLAYGPHYGVCLNKEYGKLGDPCRRLWCKNRLNRRFSPCETRSYLPVMDGTVCGFQKWCISGSCVANVKYYKKDCSDVNVSFCQKLNTAEICETETFKKICCSSCENYHYLLKKTTKKHRKKPIVAASEGESFNSNVTV